MEIINPNTSPIVVIPTACATDALKPPHTCNNGDSGGNGNCFIDLPICGGQCMIL